MPNIYFPYLNLSFNIESVAFTVFGMPIYWYGIILTTGILLGLLMAMYIAKKERMNPDYILDFLLVDIVFALVGARLYFVIFNWSYYKDHLGELFNIRQGGIAIYGAILASVIVAVVYTRVRRINFWQFGDVAAYGLLVGQAIGRYGNFVNKEAFGDYTNNMFAMRILKSDAAAALTPNILDNTVIENGLEYIQVHPTFLYESTWNLVLLIGLLLYHSHKKSHGEIFFMYMTGYGIGRFWIEGLRTDQLILNFIAIPASQVVAVMSVIIGVIGIVICRKKASKKYIFKNM
ncbi:MAG: prolipoprotein diacylglyceryl transferase [Cellulosilyticaceae bacterium]